MVTEVPEEILADLRKLAETGVTEDVLRECSNLIKILNKFACKDIPVAVCASLLQEILWSVADRVRQEAFEQYHNGDRAKHPISHAAAMTELLGLASEDFEPNFDRVWRFVWEIEKEKPPRNSNRVGHRRLRAAAWIGKDNVRDTFEHKYRYGRRMLEAFAKELLRDDDAAVRERLTTRLRQLSAPQVKEEVTASAHTLVKSTQPTPDTGRPAPRQGRVEDPELWPVLRTLVREIREQLEFEQAHGAIDNPPIPLRWSVSDKFGGLDHPPAIRESFGLPIDMPLELPYSVEGIADVLRTLRSGRLVVLGRGGAGKSAFAADLAANLLDPDKCMDGDAVPCVLDITRWNPDEKPLWDWFAEELIRKYPDVRSESKYGQNWAAKLIKNGYVLPILDRFDEIAPQFRSEGIRGIHESLPTTKKLVLLSREGEYRQAIKSSGVRFNAAVLSLKKIRRTPAATYFSVC